MNKQKTNRQRAKTFVLVPIFYCIALIVSAILMLITMKISEAIAFPFMAFALFGTMLAPAPGIILAIAGIIFSIKAMYDNEDKIVWTIIVGVLEIVGFCFLLREILKLVIGSMGV